MTAALRELGYAKPAPQKPAPAAEVNVRVANAPVVPAPPTPATVLVIASPLPDASALANFMEEDPHELIEEAQALHTPCRKQPTFPCVAAADGCATPPFSLWQGSRSFWRGLSQTSGSCGTQSSRIRCHCRRCRLNRAAHQRRRGPRHSAGGLLRVRHSVTYTPSAGPDSVGELCDYMNHTEQLKALDDARWRIAIALTVAMMVLYFGFILLVAYAKPLLGRLVVPGLSLGILLGALVIVAAWVLIWIYVRWANTHYDAAIDALRGRS